jgi:hypothetical protein
MAPRTVDGPKNGSGAPAARRVSMNYMGGVCERPGCVRPAAAAVAADPRRLIVWLGDLETSGESVNVLCAVHADNLAVPVGWERRDVREAPRLFAVPTTPPEPRPKRRRARPAAAEVADAPPPASLGDLHHGGAELSEDATVLLSVDESSPLLARAFRAARAVG